MLNEKVFLIPQTREIKTLRTLEIQTLFLLAVFRSSLPGEHPWYGVISIKMFSNFIEITLWHRCSPVTLLHIFRTPFYKNTDGCFCVLFFVHHIGCHTTVGIKKKKSKSWKPYICFRAVFRTQTWVLLVNFFSQKTSQ